MKNVVRILLLLLVLTASCGKGTTTDGVETIDTIPLLMTRIRQCSRLYTAECRVHKIVTHGDNLQIDGRLLHKDFAVDIPLGQRSVAIPIDATVKASIDFSDFSEANLRREDGKIEVVLPDPHLVLTSTRIDHQAIRQYVAMTRRQFSDAELSQYEQEGRQAIIRDLAHMGIIETARQGAAAVLVPLFQQLGFADEDITVTFRKNYGIRDIPSLLYKPTD